MRSNSFLFVLAPLRRSLYLFWRETHTNSEISHETGSGRGKEDPREDRESVDKAGKKRPVGLS